MLFKVFKTGGSNLLSCSIKLELGKEREMDVMLGLLVEVQWERGSIYVDRCSRRIPWQFMAL